MSQLTTTEWQELVNAIVLLSLLSGFTGAFFCLQIAAAWRIFERWCERRTFKQRCAAWDERRQKAAEERAAAERGDDAAGRACETRSGDAA